MCSRPGLLFGPQRPSFVPSIAASSPSRRSPASRRSSSSASTAAARRDTGSSSPLPWRTRFALPRLEQQVDGDRGLVGEEPEQLHLLQAEEGLLRAVEHRQHPERALLVQQRSCHEATRHIAGVLGDVLREAGILSGRPRSRVAFGSPGPTRRSPSRRGSVFRGACPHPRRRPPRTRVLRSPRRGGGWTTPSHRRSTAQLRRLRRARHGTTPRIRPRLLRRPLEARTRQSCPTPYVRRGQIENALQLEGR